MVVLEMHSESKNASENCRKIEETAISLIGGLPDDIALLCLVRVPRRYHHILKLVSKRWRALVSSSAWLSYRRELNLEEGWIYAICRDSLERVSCYVLNPAMRNWKLLQGLPSLCSKRYGMACEVLGGKLYLLGGWGWGGDATNEVYSYDALTNTWEKVAPLVTARCHFLCEALNDRLYAIGGMGPACGELHSWETYNPHLNTWSSQSDPNIIADLGEAVTLDGKIYVRHVSPNIIPDPYAAMYDPSTDKWHIVNDEMVMAWQGPTVVVEGNLYMLDQTMGTKLMMWRKESREWMAVGRLSSNLTRPPCRLAAIGKRIFVIGRGLSTMVLDTETFRMDRVMVSSSIAGLAGSDDVVISCKAIAI